MYLALMFVALIYCMINVDPLIQLESLSIYVFDNDAIAYLGTITFPSKVGPII